MSENIYGEGYESIGYESIYGQRASAEVQKKPWGRIVVLGLLLAIVLGECIWFCIFVPLRPLDSIRVSGNSLLTREELLQIGGINSLSSFFSINKTVVEQSIKNHYAVESVRLRKQFPDSLNINIIEKSRVAIIMAETVGDPVFLSLDKKGLVFQVDTMPALIKNPALANLPLLSGIVFEHPQIGARLPDFLLPLMQDLQELQEKYPQLLREISELYVYSEDNQSYELYIYPLQSGIRFRIGSQLNMDKLTYMMVILDLMNTENFNTKEVDIRGRIAMYTPNKEDEHAW